MNKEPLGIILGREQVAFEGATVSIRKHMKVGPSGIQLGPCREKEGRVTLLPGDVGYWGKMRPAIVECRDRARCFYAEV